MRYKIAICICTYKRLESLERLLKSLKKLKYNDTLTKNEVQLVVVDNNEGESKELVESLGLENLVWFHEPKKGLCYARNRTVELARNSSFCFFVDDDQELNQHCLTILWQTAKKSGAKIIYGSNPPIFPAEAKINPSIRAFFTKSSSSIISYVSSAPTNCTLISTNVLNKLSGPFDLRFNLTGGEDSFLTRSLNRMGYRIICNRNARAYEHIPVSRIKLSWILKRSFRESASITIQDIYLKKTYRYITLRLLKSVGKIGFGIFACFIFIYAPRYHINGLVYIAEGLGHIAGYLKIHPKEYAQ